MAYPGPRGLQESEIKEPLHQAFSHIGEHQEPEVDPCTQGYVGLPLDEMEPCSMTYWEKSR